MSELNSFYINALLAEATYAVSGDIQNGQTGQTLIDYLESKKLPHLLLSI